MIAIFLRQPTRPTAALRARSGKVGRFVVLLVALRAPFAYASNVSFETRDERDNLQITYSRSELGWISDAIGSGLLRFSLHTTYADSKPRLSLFGGFRAIGGADLGWIQGLGPVELRLAFGIDDIPYRDSWSAKGRLTYAPSFISGASARLGLTSGILDGWYTYGTRSTVATGALAYAGETDWLEAGAVVDERTGARDPHSSIAVDLRDNRLTTLYSWASHAWTSWLLAGVSAKWSDSQLDFHQPLQQVETTIYYLDYPYPTPHRETALGALLEVRIARLKLKAHWPIYSEGLYRADVQSLWAGQYFYLAHGMTVADLHASMDFHPSPDWGISVQVNALSRPYVPYKWFTADAWNQIGLNLTVQYAIRQRELPEPTENKQ